MSENEGNISLKPQETLPECLCNKIPLRNSVVVSPRCIGGMWLFADLEPAEKMALGQVVARSTYEEGRYIFAQGDPVDRMFFLKSGRVKLIKLLEDGTEITLDIRKGGDFLGENMLGEDVDYPASALCLEQTLICAVTKERFEDLVLRYPKIGLRVMKNLSKRISWLTRRVESMSLTNLEERLYQTLVHVAIEHGVRTRDSFAIRFPLTHEDLGFLVGAHRVSITRAMKELRKNGSVVQDGKSLILRVRVEGP
jgi:CRP-like cAMP-binding protein